MRKVTAKPVSRSKNPSGASASPAQVAPQLRGKLSTLATLLHRPEGATLAALAEATGWKPQSVRGALAGALKARGHVVISGLVDGVRVYRLPSPAPTRVRP